MLSVEYSPAVYDSLLNVEESNNQLNEMNKANLLVQLYSLLDAHNLLEIAKIQLLHRHFDLDKKERLAESVNYQPPQVVSCAVSDSNKMIPHIWKVCVEDGKYIWRPCEWILLSQYQPNKKNSDKKTDKKIIQKERERLQRVSTNFTQLSKNNSFLEEYGKFLIQNKLQDVCGISLVTPDSLPISDDYLPVESIDIEGKKLTVENKKKSEIEMKDVIETSWEFIAVFDEKGKKKIDPKDPKNFEKIRTRGCARISYCSKVSIAHISLFYHQRA